MVIKINNEESIDMSPDEAIKAIKKQKRENAKYEKIEEKNRKNAELIAYANYGRYMELVQRKLNNQKTSCYTSKNIKHQNGESYSEYIYTINSCCLFNSHETIQIKTYNYTISKTIETNSGTIGICFNDCHTNIETWYILGASNGKYHYIEIPAEFNPEKLFPKI